MTSAKHRFFCADPAAGFLDEDESGHALRVLRLGTGDLIELLDGKGAQHLAEVTETTKKQLFFSIRETHRDQAPSWNIHVAIAPTKNIDRFEFFLEKCTEIGITTITPLLTKNSERKEIKAEKLQKNIISAVKQSGNLFLPELAPMHGFKEFIKGTWPADVQKFMAHCEEDVAKIQLYDGVTPAKKSVILIGPEGDFTADEIQLARQAGFQPVSLGESRLRTETAGIVACLTVHLKK